MPIKATVVPNRVPVIRDKPSIWGISVGRTWSGRELDVEQVITDGDYDWAKVSAYVPIINNVTGQRYMTLDTPTDPPPPGEQILCRALHDKTLTDKGIYDYSGRMKNRHPEVYLLQNEAGREEGITQKVLMTKEVQEMCFALLRFGAPSMTLARAKNRFRAIYDFDRAFTNRSGFNNPDRAPYADFINNRDTNGHLPAFDKVRFCGGALTQGIVVGDRLNVETLTGAVPIGYLQARPWLYFTAMNSGPNPTDFDQGDGEPVFIPFIAPEMAVYYPMNRLQRVEIDNPYYVS